MRHRKSGRKLNMDATARKAMFRNMVTSLMLHGQIKTTLARAKELRRHADRVITIGKRAPSRAVIDSLSGEDQRQARANRVAAIRRARRWIVNDEAIERLFEEYADRFRARPGGYTRIVKAGFRSGDNATMAFISLMGDFDPEARKAAPSESSAPEVAEEAPEPEVAEEAAEVAEEAPEVAEEAPEAAAEEAPAEEAPAEEAPEAADAPQEDSASDASDDFEEEEATVVVDTSILADIDDEEDDDDDATQVIMDLAPSEGEEAEGTVEPDGEED